MKALALRRIYFSPEDDTKAAFLALVGSARKLIRIADYSFNLTELTQFLVAKHHDGVDVAVVLDSSQAAGKYERDDIEALRTAGVDLVIGTSEKHRIMHQKFAVVDRVVEYGSWNFSEAASAESNFLIIDREPAVVDAFAAEWQRIYDWISAHEPQDSAARTKPERRRAP